MSRDDDEDTSDAFEDSPRPAKRPRLVQRKSNDSTELKFQNRKKPARRVIDSDDALSQESAPAKPTERKASIKPRGSTSAAGSDSEVVTKVPPKRKRKSSIPNEREAAFAAKKVASRWHAPLVEEDLHDIYVSQAPVASSSPGRIRGAIWLKRPPLTEVTTVRGNGQGITTTPGAVQKPIQCKVEAPKVPIAVARAIPQVASLESTAALARAAPAAQDPILRSLSVPTGVDMPPLDKRNMHQPQIAVPDMHICDELDGLPSDAFASSPPPSSPPRVIASGPSTTAQPVARPIQSEMRQTTLLGKLAQNPTTVASQLPRKQTWPLASKTEKPTHHELDLDAAKTWVYPTNLGTIRDYQYNIVQIGLFHNLLVALPTGLGKTFIAATIMLNWYRWTKSAQIVFLAPTKPLVSQQIEACFNVVGIPRSQTVMLTGGVSPALRAREWLDKRVFFMTPQTIMNDLKSGAADPKRFVLLVIDEAHRATGNYSYIEVVKFMRRFNQSFRVLALTATPGGDVETVQQVIDGLDIARTEIRTEHSIDIRGFVHSKDVETVVFDYSDEQETIMELLSQSIKPVLDKLNSQNAYWQKNPMKLTPFGLRTAQQTWAKSEAGRSANQGIKGMISSIFTLLSSLAHCIPMLKFHGITPFFQIVNHFKNTVDSGETKSKNAALIRNHASFGKMISLAQTWTNNPEFVGHPKSEHLRNIVMNHFLDAGEGQDGVDTKSATRVMVFAHFRDSAEDVCRILKRNSPMIRPHVFVGQSSSKNSEGMTQKTQLDVIQKFKDGVYNVLVATSIGEEGLDIGEVDLIVCYDASSSPIRMLQRMGRTGRKRKGNIVLLLMREKEADDFASAKDNYEKMQGMIASGSHFSYHEDISPRILPKDIKPVVDKRVVEIPVENTQTAGLPEPSKTGKRPPKRSPKKFHMPDGVRTGFMKASKVGEESGDEAEEAMMRVLDTVKPPVFARSPEVMVVPEITDVVLNKIQNRELERKYQYVNSATESLQVTAPQPERYPDLFANLGLTRHIEHGRVSRDVASMMQRMRGMDDHHLNHFKIMLDIADVSADPVGMTVDKTQEPRNEDLQDEDSLDEDLPCIDMVMERPMAPPPSRPVAQVRPTPQRPAAQRREVNSSTSASTKVNQRIRQRLQRISSAMEAHSSSPAQTPADMRLRSQAVDLGSGDTSGEDEPEEHDSELADFVVASDATIEMMSSSMPQIYSRKSTKARIRLDELFSDDEKDGHVEVGESSVVVLSSEVASWTGKRHRHVSPEVVLPAPRARKQKRTVVSDSDD